MTRMDFKKLIIKYTWILILYYLLISCLPKVTSNILFVMTDKWGWTPSQAGMYMLLFSWISYLFNIIIALIMYLDYRKNNIRNPWTVVLTLLFIPAGVCVFFINYFYTYRLEK